MSIIGTIIFGAVIGILARLVLPGKQPMGWIITIVLGIAGALIGYYVWGELMGKGDTGGIDWIRWIISIAAAAVLCAIYGAIVSRRRPTRT
ncbi:MAG: GlsB/YeaQ/YmgE family stress response membrane protein [Aldersonia sp.]|nr:GlsB/YeaQ/YmgE family stress response membrane protein [Aldersonia sp.]